MCIRCLVAERHRGFHNNESISDGREAHPDYATVLHDLHVYIKDMIDRGDVATDVDEIVGIAQAACRPCPLHHSGHVMSLVVTLVTFHRNGCQLQGAITDLNMAIMLYREVMYRFLSQIIQRTHNIYTNLHGVYRNGLSGYPQELI